MSVAVLRNEAVNETRQVASDVLGALEVPADRVVRFPQGLLGFPDAREFVLVAAAREGTYWLQSVEHASLIFLVIDPFLHFPDYAVDLSRGDVASLDASAESDIAILAVVTLPGREGDACTANLQGPLALNLERGVARQIILRNADAGVRRTVRLEEPPAV